MRARRQCAKCPWRVGIDPFDIPNGYNPDQHAALTSTIASPAEIPMPGSPLRMMACHETTGGDELPCVGWLVHQIGPGNNIGLRLAAASGHVDMNVKPIGEQHACLADTLPTTIAIDTGGSNYERSGR